MTPAIIAPAQTDQRAFSVLETKMARRRYQQGSLFLRGKDSKVWVGRWREDLIEDGKLKRVYKNEVLGNQRELPTKKIAQRALNDRLSTINSPTYRARPTATFKEFAERWQALVLSQHKRSTQLSEKSAIRRHLVPMLGALPVKDISAVVVQGVVTSLAVAPKTTKNIVGTLRVMWNSAKAWGYVNHDPFEGLRMPAPTRPQQLFFSLRDVQNILAEAEEPYQTFYRLAVETGLRSGELCGLTLEDVDATNNLIRVRQSVWRGQLQTPKTRAAFRTFAISEQLAEQLATFIESWKPNAAHLLFATRNGTPWDANLVVKRKLHPLLDRLGIERCGLHAFRHGNATLMNQLNTDLKTRMARLGHTDTRMTLGNYTHAVSEDDRLAAAQLGELFKTQTEKTLEN
jgi:integrase